MALGKGLSALINQDLKESGMPAVAAAEQKVAQDFRGVLEVEVGLIRDNRFQPRQHYAEAALDELAASIKEKGLLQPILVRKHSDGYEVVAGERRLKAARKLGLSKVPVIIREVTDKEALVLALVENVQREELDPIEKAQSYRRLCDEFGYSQDEIAKSVGKDRATISNLLRLLKLSDEMQTAVSEGKIAEGHARALLSVEDANARKLLFLEAVSRGLSVREVEARAKKAAGGASSKNESRLPLKDPEIVTLEEDLRRIFGTKVSINNKRGNKGKLIIEYYSLSDFDRIMGVVRK